MDNNLNATKHKSINKKGYKIYDFLLSISSYYQSTKDSLFSKFEYLEDILFKNIYSNSSNSNTINKSADYIMNKNQTLNKFKILNISNNIFYNKYDNENNFNLFKNMDFKNDKNIIIEYDYNQTKFNNLKLSVNDLIIVNYYYVFDNKDLNYINKYNLYQYYDINDNKDKNILKYKFLEKHIIIKSMSESNNSTKYEYNIEEFIMPLACDITKHAILNENENFNCKNIKSNKIDSNSFSTNCSSNNNSKNFRYFCKSCNLDNSKTNNYNNYKLYLLNNKYKNSSIFKISNYFKFAIENIYIRKYYLVIDILSYLDNKKENKNLIYFNLKISNQIENVMFYTNNQNLFCSKQKNEIVNKYKLSKNKLNIKYIDRYINCKNNISYINNSFCKLSNNNANYETKLYRKHLIIYNKIINKTVIKHIEKSLVIKSTDKLIHQSLIKFKDICIIDKNRNLIFKCLTNIKFFNDASNNSNKLHVKFSLLNNKCIIENIGDIIKVEYTNNYNNNNNTTSCKSIFITVINLNNSDDLNIPVNFSYVVNKTDKNSIQFNVKYNLIYIDYNRTLVLKKQNFVDPLPLKALEYVSYDRLSGLKFLKNKMSIL